MMKYYRAIFVLSIFVFAVSCNAKNSESADDFDKLCGIYNEIVPQKIDIDIKMGKLAERVNEDMPDFFKNYFSHVQRMDANKRYNYIKQSAEKAKGGKWECDVMKSFYDNNFK